jgi:hypothetical protein
MEKDLGEYVLAFDQIRLRQGQRGGLVVVSAMAAIIVIF